MEQHQTVHDAEENLDILDQARTIVNVITDMKGENILLLDLREITLITDFFIICTGGSDRQLRAIVDRVSEKIQDIYDRKVWRTEGDPAGGWVLMDYGDIVVHAFSKTQREYYDLEGLWREGKTLLRIQ